MNKTIKLLKKIIFISNLDKYSKGFNNILFLDLYQVFLSSLYFLAVFT